MVSVQHEFGIFGGPEGRWVTDFMDATTAPVVTTLHTVLPDPPAEYRQSLLAVIERSDRLAVMTETARDLLCEVYGADRAKVAVIPHGTPVLTEPAPGLRQSLGLEGRTVLLTFGLLGPSKGIEFALDALAPVAAEHPEVLAVRDPGRDAHPRSSAATARRTGSRSSGGSPRSASATTSGSWTATWTGRSSASGSRPATSTSRPTPAWTRSAPARWPTPWRPASRSSRRPTSTRPSVLANGAGALVPFDDHAGFSAALAGYVGDA